MATSLFNRLYSYRQRELKNARENFLIEIMVYCLESNLDFRNAFLELTEVSEWHKPSDDISISSQAIYDEGRPDIEITFGTNKCVLIECKVDSSEGHEQLNRYKKILKSKKLQHQKLVFLTKYYEEPRDNVLNIRWFQIVDILQTLDRGEILDQFYNYLLEENMEAKEFDLHDLVAIQQMKETMSKMDEVLDRFKNEAKSVLKITLPKWSSRSTGFQNHGFYGDYVKLSNGSSLIIGFKARGDHKNPEVFFEFTLKHSISLTETKINFIATELGFNNISVNKQSWVGVYKPITSLLESDKGSLEECYLFLKSAFDKLEEKRNVWEGYL